MIAILLILLRGLKMVRRKKKKRKRGTRRSNRKGKPSGRAGDIQRTVSEKGFTPPQRKTPKTTMNIGKLSLRVKEGRIPASKENDEWTLQLGELGIDKILGAGKVDIPMKIRLPQNVEMTSKVKKKVENAGGEIHIIEE